MTQYTITLYDGTKGTSSVHHDPGKAKEVFISLKEKLISTGSIIVDETGTKVTFTGNQWIKVTRS